MSLIGKYFRILGQMLNETLIRGEGLFIDHHLPNGQAIIPTPGGVDRFIDVGGINYHYVEYPAVGPDVLMIHGVGSSTYTWEKVAPMLQRQNYHVWALDMKGFGWSDKPEDAKYDAETLMREVKAWMDAIGLKKVILVGNSLGGGISVMLSIDYPQMIDRLILIDAAGYPQVRPPIVLMTFIPGVPHLIKILYGRWAMMWSLGEVFHHIGWVTTEAINAYLTRNSTEGALDAQIKVSRALQFKRFTPYINRIPEIKAPTLIIHGQEDVWVPVANSRRFRKEISSAILAEVPHCGHAVQEEYPELAARLLLDFIEGRLVNDPVIPVNPKGGDAID